MSHHMITYKIAYLVMYVAHVMDSEVKSFTIDAIITFTKVLYVYGRRAALLLW